MFVCFLVLVGMLCLLSIDVDTSMSPTDAFTAALHTYHLFCLGHCSTINSNVTQRTHPAGAVQQLPGTDRQERVLELGAQAQGRVFPLGGVQVHMLRCRGGEWHFSSIVSCTPPLADIVAATCVAKLRLCRCG